jgi:hypothetical protein
VRRLSSFVISIQTLILKSCNLLRTASFNVKTHIMKKILLASLLFAAVPAFAGGWEVIEGNGNLKKETRNASGYTGVSSGGAFDVDISYGTSNTITVEADDNLLPYIETVVEDNELKLRTKKGYSFKTKNKMKITVSLTKLTSLRVSGSGNVKGDGNFSNNGTTDISISGSGDIRLNFDRFAAMEVKISGSGNMHLKGKETSKINATVSGSGNIDAYDVSASEVTARVSGSGNVNVTANKSIDASISGSGNVNYKGSAADIKQRASGSGKVRKV